MNARNGSAYPGQVFSQQQIMYQQQQQQYYAQAMWQPMPYQPLMVHHQPFAVQQQSRQVYASSPTCPSLYSLQQQSSAFPQQKLVPSQIAPSRERVVDYRSHQVLQPPFQLNQSQQQRPVDPWSGYNNSWQQQYPQRQPVVKQQQQYVDENDPFSDRPAQPLRSKSYDYLSQQPEYVDPSIDPLKDLKLIPASASQIPPHPPIEKSAVPLTDFAVELIWEVCQNAKEQATAMKETRIRQTSEPSTPGQYGSIGGERAARKTKSFNSPASLDELYFSGTPSYLSSPESPAGPLTPPSSTMSIACPIPVQFQNGKAEFMSAPTASSPWSREYESPSLGYQEENGPTPAFRKFVKDLLTLTLVTPQVLLLAMLYVARIPSITSGRGEGWNKFLGKGLAYKMVLGSLICANKHLDDNSFRCSTWASVSSCPIDEVTQAEALILKSLHFDLNVSSQEWSSWMQTMVERRARQNPSIEDMVLARLCGLVDEVEDQIFRL